MTFYLQLAFYIYCVVALGGSIVLGPLNPRKPIWIQAGSLIGVVYFLIVMIKAMIRGVL